MFMFKIQKHFDIRAILIIIVFVIFAIIVVMQEHRIEITEEGETQNIHEYKDGITIFLGINSVITVVPKIFNKTFISVDKL